MTKAPRYVSAFKDRHGKTRYKFRRKGYQCYLPGPIGSEAFDEAYADALGRAPRSTAKAGTFAKLIEEYYQSLSYQKLRPVTQQTYRRWLDFIKKEHGHRTVGGMTAQHLENILAKMADQPKNANKVRRYFRFIMRFAVKRQYRADNPLEMVEGYKTEGGHKTWPLGLIEQYRDYWKRGAPERLLIDLTLYTGLRRADLVQVTRAHLKAGEVQSKQQKTGAPVWIPIHPELMATIQATDFKGMYFIETKTGRPRSAETLTNYFRDACDDAKIPKGYSLHGLRKSCATFLAEAGCSSKQIAAITGHATLKEVERYTKDADQKRLAREAMEKWK